MELANTNNAMMEIKPTNDIFYDMQMIIETAQRQAYNAVDVLLVQRNWLIGSRIAAEAIGAEDRAKYGAEIIKTLSKELTEKYGKGFDKTNLYYCLRFYNKFPQIVDTVCQQSHIALSWSHYRALVRVEDNVAREWYEKEANEQGWSVRTLRRNIETQYYYRLLQSQNKELVEGEMKTLTKEFQDDKLEFIKNPVVAEFR